MIAGDAELVLGPGIGGSITSWRAGGIDILRAAVSPDVRDQGSYPLVPYSNRVAGRSFTFEGHRTILPALLQTWAIHGAGWQLPWELDGDTMRLDYPGGELWPYAFEAEQRFSLSPRALSITTRLVNRHSGRAPAAIGQHPFFARPADMTVRFAAREVWRNGPDSLPDVRTAVPPEWDFCTPHIPEAHADNCFVGWDGTAELACATHAVSLRADPCFGNLIFYAPVGRDFICLEPVMNMTDGLNRMDDRDCGIVMLDPGAATSGTITMELAL